MSKFQALKTLLQDALPAVAKEGEEAAASAIAKEAEEAAADKAFKQQFEQGWYHGTNEEKTDGKIIKEFNPNSFFAKDSDFSGYYAGHFRGEKGSQIIPVSLNTKNFFNPENSSHLKTLEDSLIKHYETNPEMRLFEKMLYPEYVDYHTDPVKRAKFIIDSLKQRIKSNESTWAILEDKNIEQALKNAGYEGALLKEMGRPTAISYYSKNARLPWAKFDPSKKDSGDTLAGLGAATLGAGALSSEAKAEPTKSSSDFTNIKKQLIKDYSPSFGSKEGDFSSYDESEALPTEGMQGRGLATIIRNIVADKKPPSEFTPGDFSEGEYTGGGGIYGGNLLDSSILDFLTPGMVAAPAKALGRGALTAGKAGLEAVESGAQAFSKRYPELAKRLADNRGSIDLKKKRKSWWDTATEEQKAARKAAHSEKIKAAYEQKTPEQKAAFKEKMRALIDNKSEEEKAAYSAAQSERIKASHANMTPEEKAARSKSLSEAWTNMTDEERAARIESQKKAWTNKSEEQKAAHGKAVADRFANMSDEEKAKWAKMTSDRFANMSDEELAAWGNMTKSRWANMTDEEKAAIVEKISQGKKESWANISEEDYNKFIEEAKTRFSALSDEEKRKALSAMNAREFNKTKNALKK